LERAPKRSPDRADRSRAVCSKTHSPQRCRMASGQRNH